jgi:hypothetical protein
LRKRSPPQPQPLAPVNNSSTLNNLAIWAKIWPNLCIYIILKNSLFHLLILFNNWKNYY